MSALTRMRLRDHLAAFLLLTAALTGFWLLLVARDALADVPACPDPPAAYTGTDDAAAAVNQLDVDLAASCKAQTARLDQLDTDSTSASTQAHGDAGDVKTAVQDVTAQLKAWTSTNPLPVALPGGGSGQAVAVTNWPSSQPVSFDPSASSQLDGNAQSEHGDLWVIVGAIVAVFLFDVVLRKVWP